jgi:hypothetical protein
VHFSALIPPLRVLYLNVYSHEDRMTWSADGSVGTNSVYWKESQVKILKVDSYEVVEFCRNKVAEEILMSEAMGLCLTLLCSTRLALLAASCPFRCRLAGA